MIKANFSTTYDAKRKRVERLPVLAEKYMSSRTKRDAYGVVEEFRQGIIKNNFKLQRLAESTIRSKRTRGYSRPNAPLYGLGTDSDRSYLNMMRVAKLKSGYKVQPSRGNHHSGRITLRKLYLVHEFGTTIRQKRRLIHIPPRPAFAKAFKRYIRRRRKMEPSPDVRAIMTEYINSGRQSKGRKFQNEVKKLRKWDEGRT